ncbi:uncharacterized protein EI90DRAFT_3102880 [Cantharellus anzutake]|uniref:uncharacterized protein n=1 Tax=Cantharellus anzutake TaxID=1750568 RepID=UPI0019083A10|nr:uncharacterized protein EI90DRAFT_3102880 [Cantharellus anzutake]KAF8309963.1 hypothetical protein EI90DRAFT_3102880 [Cantharellus anzutake]
MLNPRMFEAALAGVGATSLRSKERRDQKLSGAASEDNKAAYVSAEQSKETVFKEKKLAPVSKAKKGRDASSNPEPSGSSSVSLPRASLEATDTVTTPQSQPDSRAQAASRQPESPRGHHRRGRGKGRGGARGGAPSNSQRQDSENPTGGG